MSLAVSGGGFGNSSGRVAAICTPFPAAFANCAISTRRLSVLFLMISEAKTEKKNF
jgi:hypothetical protein